MSSPTEIRFGDLDLEPLSVSESVRLSSSIVVEYILEVVSYTLVFPEVG